MENLSFTEKFAQSGRACEYYGNMRQHHKCLDTIRSKDNNDTHTIEKIIDKILGSPEEYTVKYFSALGTIEDINKHAAILHERLSEALEVMNKLYAFLQARIGFTIIFNKDSNTPENILRGFELNAGKLVGVNMKNEKFGYGTACSQSEGPIFDYRPCFQVSFNERARGLLELEIRNCCIMSGVFLDFIYALQSLAGEVLRHRKIAISDKKVANEIEAAHAEIAKICGNFSDVM